MDAQRFKTELVKKLEAQGFQRDEDECYLITYSDTQQQVTSWQLDGIWITITETIPKREDDELPF